MFDGLCYCLIVDLGIYWTIWLWFSPMTNLDKLLELPLTTDYWWWTDCDRLLLFYSLKKIDLFDYCLSLRTDCKDSIDCLI